MPAIKFSSHYSKALVPEKMVIWGRKASDELIKFSRAKAQVLNRSTDEVIPVLMYTGMSGISHAQTLSLMLHMNYPEFEFRMMYVRKREEDSHGQRIEHNLCPQDDKVYLFGVFVDDFISSGATMREVARQVESFFVNNSDPGSGFYSIHGVNSHGRGESNMFEHRLTYRELIDY